MRNNLENSDDVGGDYGTTETLAQGMKLTGKRAAVVTFSPYPGDPRPLRETEVLRDLGMDVEILCIPSEDGESPKEVRNGISISRIPVQKVRGKKLGYLTSYFSFLFAVFVILAERSFARDYSVVHVHNMPDFLVFAALVPKLRGAKVILDLHDPMPELMQTIFGVDEKHYIVKALKLCEKWSTGFADMVITVNKTCHDIFARRSCAAEKIKIVMNFPDEQMFPEEKPGRMLDWAMSSERPFVLMYHGSFVERNGLDLAILALKKVKASIPNAVLRVYGEQTPFLEQAMRLARTLGVEGSVYQMGLARVEDLAVEIQRCDVGIIPNRDNLFTKLNTPTRIFEYVSQGKPVIAPRAAGVLECFSERELMLFELGSADDIAQKIEHLFRNPEEAYCMAERAQVAYQKFKWSKQREQLGNYIVQMVEGVAR